MSPTMFMPLFRLALLLAAGIGLPALAGEITLPPAAPNGVTPAQIDAPAPDVTPTPALETTAVPDATPAPEATPAPAITPVPAPEPTPAPAITPAPSETRDTQNGAPGGVTPRPASTPTLSDLGRSLRDYFTEDELTLLFEYMRNSVIAAFKGDEVYLPPDLAFKLEVLMVRMKKEGGHYMDNLIRQLERDLARSIKEKLKPPPVRDRAYTLPPLPDSMQPATPRRAPAPQTAPPGNSR